MVMNHNEETENSEDGSNETENIGKWLPKVKILLEDFLLE